jgi:hypothetical protein
MVANTNTYVIDEVERVLDAILHIGTERHIPQLIHELHNARECFLRGQGCFQQPASHQAVQLPVGDERIRIIVDDAIREWMNTKERSELGTECVESREHMIRACVFVGLGVHNDDASPLWDDERVERSRLTQSIEQAKGAAFRGWHKSNKMKNGVIGNTRSWKIVNPANLKETRALT